LEDDYADWKIKFWEVARRKYNVMTEVDTQLKPFEPSFLFIVQPFDANKPEEKTTKPPIIHPQMDPKHGGSFVTVLTNEELRQNIDSGSTHHISFDLTSSKVKYRTADNLGVYPRNDHKQVAKLLKRLDADAKSTFTWKDRGKLFELKK